MLLKKKDFPKNSYDIIVIGGGLGGMTAANVAAKKNGRKVLLLEAHNKLGGFATWFYRNSKQHIFDVSLHGFPYGMVKTCKKYWGGEIASKIVQLKDVRFINPQFNLSTTFTQEDFTQKLIHFFGVEEKTVLDFFQFIKQMNFYDDQKMTISDLFNKFFPDRSDIARFLLEPITYANGSSLEDPAISYGIVFSNFMNKGVFTFHGGTDQLISLMQTELLNNDVDIKMHSYVDQIWMEDGRAQGVILKGQKIRAQAVISNANIRSTLTQLIEPENLPKELQQKAEGIRLNSSSCQVYIGLKKEFTLPHIGDLIFTSKATHYNKDLILSAQITSRTFSIYYPESRPEHNRTTIVSSTNALYADWKSLTPDQYAQAKEKMIEETILALEELVPGISQQIDFTDAATPLTVEKYTHHPEGTSFGTKFESLPISMQLSKHIPGLYHAGSVGIIMSGWLGAANYGAIVASNIENQLLESSA